MKICTKCKIEKDNIYYYPIKAGWGRSARLSSACKECIKKQTGKFSKINRKQVNAYAKSKGYWSWSYKSKRQAIPSELQIEIKDRDQGVCCFCFGSGGTVEHLTPITRGGDNNYNNLITLCSSCNSSKNNQTFLEWLFEQVTGRRHFIMKPYYN